MPSTNIMLAGEPHKVGPLTLQDVEEISVLVAPSDITLDPVELTRRSFIRALDIVSYGLRTGGEDLSPEKMRAMTISRAELNLAVEIVLQLSGLETKGEAKADPSIGDGSTAA